MAEAGQKVGLNNYGLERQETSLQKARNIVSVELQRLGLAEEDLARLPKGDARKVALARRLRQEKTTSLKWIAQRLRMGNWTYVSNLLSHEPMPRTEPAGQLLLYQ